METQILLSQCRDEVCELKAKVALLEKALDGAISPDKLLVVVRESCTTLRAATRPEKKLEIKLAMLEAQVAHARWLSDELRAGNLDIYIKLEGL